MSAIQLPACLDNEIGYKNNTLTGPVTIANKGLLELSGVCVINGSVCIEDGGDLEIPAGASVTINGPLCIEQPGLAAPYQTEYENHVWGNGGGSLTVNGVVTIAPDCDCSGCD